MDVQSAYRKSGGDWDGSIEYPASCTVRAYYVQLTGICAEEWSLNTLATTRGPRRASARGYFDKAPLLPLLTEGTCCIIKLGNRGLINEQTNRSCARDT